MEDHPDAPEVDAAHSAEAPVDSDEARIDPHVPPPAASGGAESAPGGGDEPDDRVAQAASAPPPVSNLPPPPEPTGVAGVDAALQRLRDVDSAPLDEHVEIFDDVQRQLHDALAELDDEQ